MPKVSVVIPTYNREDYIAETIQSVFNQTFSDWEIVVLDDGSMDQTRQVVEKFGDRVKYVYQQNAGETAARNAGFAHAAGEYISFLDSDDIMLPHNLECLVPILDANPQTGVSYGWYYWMDQYGQGIDLHDAEFPQHLFSQQDSPWPDRNLLPNGTTLEGQIFSRLLMEETMLMGSTLMRRECVEKVGGFDPKVEYQGHWEFYLRVARAGYGYQCARRPVAVIRLHQGNRGRNYLGMMNNRVNILNLTFQRLPDGELSQEIQDQAYYRAYMEGARELSGHEQYDEAIMALKNAAAHVSRFQVDEETLEIARFLTPHFFAQNPQKPHRAAEAVFLQIAAEEKTAPLRKKVLADLHAELAFRQSKDHPWQSFKHGVLALRNNPEMRRNRGLMRLMLETILTPRGVAALRGLTQPVDKGFINAIASRPCVFISPHFDDAALSCGGLLAGLADHHAKIELLTIFTEDAPPDLTLSPVAKEIHGLWGIQGQPFEARKKEETRLVEALNADYIWLGFLDVIYRQADISFTHESLAVNVPPEEDTAYLAVRGALRQQLERFSNPVVFSPLGLGHHPDHLLVFKVVESLRPEFPEVTFFAYEDFPYAIEADLSQRLAEMDQKPKPLTINIAHTLAERARFIEFYQSQLSSLFDPGVSTLDAVKSYAQRVGGPDSPRERYWRWD
jgi:glycosyltransferase involved in cell wall biosynthesis/LmbE family N-acetylglucosaminyl deacetylase